MDIDEVLTTTRAVRKRLDLDRPVERSVVEECLEIALQAPNGSNRQLWKWIVIDDPTVRSAVADIYRAAIGTFASDNTDYPVGKRDAAQERMNASVMYLAENLHRVPVLVLPVIPWDLTGANIFYQGSVWGSMLPAVWSFMLALRSRGLGSAWTTIHLWRSAEMAELLGIPERHTQAGLFPVAYTIGTDFKAAARRPLQDVVGWNHF